MAAPSSSTRWPTSPRSRSPRSSGCSRRASSSGWTGPRPSGSTCGSSPPPTRTSWRSCAKSASGKTSITGSTSARSPPRRSASAGKNVAMLAQHFLRVYAAKDNRRLEGFTDEALTCLEAHSWPGNVRELENVIERAVVLARGGGGERDDLPDEIQFPQDEGETGGPQAASRLPRTPTGAAPGAAALPPRPPADFVDLLVDPFFRTKLPRRINRRP